MLNKRVKQVGECMKNTLEYKIWKLINLIWKTKRLLYDRMKIEILRNQLNKSCMGYIEKKKPMKPC